jgi:hypothetical protein
VEENMTEAVVQAGAIETRYTRTGRGPHLLVLGREQDSHWMGALLPRLAERFRIFIPELPAWVAAAPAARHEAAVAAHAEAVAAWLRGVIGGLGLDQPGLVAAAPLAELLLRFAATDGHRLDRIALVAPPPEATPAGIDSTAGGATIHDPAIPDAPATGTMPPASAVLLFPAPAGENAYQALLAFLQPED